jgi:O-acetyl-ADP-ribose deacetylase (regulator of RNase III)
MGVIRKSFTRPMRESIRNVNEMVAGVHKTVGLPLIGAGLANGDWEVISKIIEEEAVDFEPVVYVIDEKVFEALALDYGSANLI